MRRRARTDRNQQEIVQAMRDYGATVLITSQLGEGAPDLIIGLGGINALVEIKDGKRPPSERRLTPDEQAFRSSWRGWYEVVESVEQALDLCGRIRRLSV